MTDVLVCETNCRISEQEPGTSRPEASKSKRDTPFADLPVWSTQFAHSRHDLIPPAPLHCQKAFNAASSETMQARRQKMRTTRPFVRCKEKPPVATQWSVPLHPGAAPPGCTPKAGCGMPRSGFFYADVLHHTVTSSLHCTIL